MRNNRPLIISFACVIALIILMSGADEVHLKGGTVIRGRIAEEGTESVKVENPDLGLLTFPRERIEKIVRDAPQITASPTHAAPPASDAPVLRPVAATDDVLDGYDAVLFGVVNEVHVGPEGKNWFPAASFMQLKVRDEIRTGLGKTRIKLRGRGEVRLPPNSQMLLALVEGNGTQVTIELKGGRVWNQITPGGGIVNYTIKTPDLVAGVQGTLFKVSLDEAEGARLAVFEGRVAATAPRSAQEQILDANFFIATDREGRFIEKKAVDPEEIKEWTEWDEWALEVHREIASRFVVGGAQIDAMARMTADEQKRYEAIMNDANSRIIINREADRIMKLREPFLSFARDTGIAPSTELGFGALIENPGFPGWNGPYIEQQTLPILDLWGRPLRYVLKKSGQSGNLFGEVISNGPDRVDQDGAASSDDIKAVIPFYQLHLQP